MLDFKEFSKLLSQYTKLSQNDKKHLFSQLDINKNYLIEFNIICDILLNWKFDHSESTAH